MLFIWILVFILGISLLVTIHELGHFTFAKFAKMEVSEFSIGFGPAILQKTFKETTFSLRIIPLGGYVAVLSDRIKKTIENIQNADIQDHDQWELLKKQAEPFNIEKDYANTKTYENASYWKKSLFIMAGVTFNYIFAVIVLLFVYGINGQKTFTNEIFVSESSNNGINTDFSTEWDKIPIINKNPELKMKERFLYNDRNDKTTPTPIWQYLPLNDPSKKINNVKYDFTNTTIKNACVNLWKNVSNPTNSCSLDANGNDVIPKEGNPVVPESVNSNSRYTVESYHQLIEKRHSFVEAELPLINEKPTLEWSWSSFIVFDLVNGDDEYFVSLPSQRVIEINNSDELKYAYYPILGDLFIGGSGIVEYQKMSAGQVIGRSLIDPFVYSIEMFLLLGQAFVGDRILSTNIGFRQVMADGTSWSTTAAGIFTWSVFISSNLILFNIFPWPPLDGYRFVEATYEEVSKKKVNPKVEQGLKTLGIMFTIFFLFIIIL